MRAKHLFLDLLDFKADFLTVRREEEEAPEALPALELVGVPLVGLGPKGVHEAGKDLAAINFNLLRSLDLH